jgi:hypothetical protein
MWFPDADISRYGDPAEPVVAAVTHRGGARLQSQQPMRARRSLAAVWLGLRTVGIDLAIQMVLARYINQFRAKHQERPWSAPGNSNQIKLSMVASITQLDKE